jgi:hypothetical protein
MCSRCHNGAGKCLSTEQVVSDERGQGWLCSDGQHAWASVSIAFGTAHQLDPIIKRSYSALMALLPRFARLQLVG